MKSFDMRISDNYSRDVSARRPALLPLFRSANQLRLLATLLLEPERRYDITRLASVTGIPQASVSREVKNLVAAGVVASENESGRRMLRADTASPIFPELAGMLLKTYGPKVVVERHLAGLPGMERALIYGSWAKRYSGIPGPPPQDVDVMVVGRPDPREVNRRADAASQELGRDVNASILTPEELADSRSGFLAEVLSSPVVELAVL